MSYEDVSIIWPGAGKGTGNDVRRYGGISNWKGLPANVSFSP